MTGSRAEFGLLYPLMVKVTKDPDLELQTIVTGTHLEAAFGYTVDSIRSSGIPVSAEVPLEIRGDSAIDTAAAMSRALEGLSRSLEDLRPDYLVLLGDRYETLAAAQAALLCHTPVAHIHGGELTHGALDDVMRHAITKLSHLHFAAAEPYRRRIIQMGENPDRVFTTGAIGLDNFDLIDRPTLDELENVIGFELGKYFLVTYHSETLGNIAPGDAVSEMLSALDRFPDFRLLITGVNADPGHSQISARLHSFAKANKQRVLMTPSLGQKNYLAAMSYCAAVIGNSSSGIIEAPAIPVPTVNIGGRQAGRLRADSVVDCGHTSVEIETAINLAISSEFVASLGSTSPPYGGGGAAEKIVAVLKSSHPGSLIKKGFRDILFSEDA